MKKILTAILILVSIHPVFAATEEYVPSYISEISRPIQLQGAVDEIASVEFDAISAQTQSYLIGMPFNILDQTVQHSAGVGRVIARWSMLSNTLFDLKFNVVKYLHHEEDTNVDRPLYFILTLTYNLSYYDNNSAKSVLGSITFNATETPSVTNEIQIQGQGNPIVLSPSSTDPTRISVIPESVVPDIGAFIGSVDGIVYFKFAAGQESNLDSMEYAPSGDYSADIQVEVITK